MDGFGGWGLPPILQIIRTGLGTTSGEGLVLLNDTPAASGAQQISPRVRWTGSGQKTDAPEGSQTVDWKAELVPVEGAANPQARLDFNYQINGAGYQATPTISLLNGNVGIGTVAPLATLGINGRVAIGLDLSGLTGSYDLVISSTEGGIILDRTGGGEAFIRITSDGVGGGQLRGIAAGGIRVTNNDGSNETIRIDNSVNVGIGTSTFGTSAVKVLALGAGTAPSTSPADVAQLWSADVNAEAGKNSLMLRSEITANGNGAVVGAFIKATTGDLAAGYEGMIQINTFDNTAKIWADGAWRAIATAW